MWIDDQIIGRAQEKLVVDMWVPDRSFIVLGRSNQAENELNLMSCQQDGMEILQRYGGGGTVLLYPGCLVVSVGAWVASLYDNAKYFRLLNLSIIDCLSLRLKKKEFAQRGFSDIVVGDQKIAGTSLFRSKNYLLYQASILISLDIRAIKKYLAHPSKEPDYRQSRSHEEFMTSVDRLEEDNFDSQAWLDHFKKHYESCLETQISDELIEVDSKHLKHLYKRLDT